MLGTYDSSVRVFKPNGTVTRSDFLVMAMDASGITVSAGESGFFDEAEFSPYEQKYIATATALGIAVGIDTDEGRCFLPDQAITDEEAALIVCRIAALNGLDFVENNIAVSVMDNDDYDALAVLANADIYESEERGKTLSRGDTVKILYSLFKYTEKE